MSPTFDRSSIRRSLPATSAASRSTFGSVGFTRRAVFGSVDLTRGGAGRHVATGDVHRSLGQGLGPLELMGCHEHRCAGRGRVVHETVDLVASRLVETGVRLIEQPELRTASQQHRERHPATLPSREAPDGNRGESAREPQSSHGRVAVAFIAPSGSRPEAHVVAHTEVVVERGAVTEKSYLPPHRCPFGAQIVAEYDGIAVDDGKQSGAGAQQARLARTVCALKQDDLAPRDIEISTCKCRESTDERDGAAKVDGWLHGAHRGYWRASRPTKVAAGVLSVLPTRRFHPSAAHPGAVTLIRFPAWLCSGQ